MTKQWEAFSQNIDKNPLRVFVLYKIIGGEIMKKLFAGIFGWLARSLGEEQEIPLQQVHKQGFGQEPLA